MIDLRASQQAVYAAVKAVHPRAFLRLCTGEEALWVSDLPRHCPQMQPFLVEEVRTWMDEKRGLLYLDWTEKTWNRQLVALPSAIPTFPPNEDLQPMYALCRLLLAHPHARLQEHMPFLRRLLITLQASPQKLAHVCTEMREETAVLLRSGKAVPYDAGRLLAAWIQEKEERK